MYVSMDLSENLHKWLNWGRNPLDYSLSEKINDGVIKDIYCREVS